MKCCVPSCSNYDGKQGENERKITFHLFPSDANVREIWRKAVNKGSEWQPTNKTKICCVHFKENMIYKTKKGLTKIRFGAVPTLNLNLTKANTTEITKQNKEDVDDNKKKYGINKYLTLNDTPHRLSLKQEIYRLKIREKKLNLKVRRLQMSENRLKKKVELQYRKRLKIGAVPHFNMLNLNLQNVSTKTILTEQDETRASSSGVSIPQDIIKEFSSSTPPTAESATNKADRSIDSDLHFDKTYLQNIFGVPCDGIDVGGSELGSTNKDVVDCTPSFPLEPLCHVTEENNGDLSAPVPYPKPHALPISDNIVQMTENDVTLNPSTGGLKFRVDPQTLSSNKMYRMPDGRIFAINANPNVPGGYSATIVAITDTTAKVTPKTGVNSAKLSAVSLPSPKSYTNTSKSNKNYQNKQKLLSKLREKSLRNNVTNEKETERINSKQCDLKVPVEWYRSNLIDAVDALQYSLSRLLKLKTEATTVYLRTRSVSEMLVLHKRLDRLLNTSTTRFNEIKSHLNTEMKSYLQKKMATANNDISDDDDDVGNLNDSGDADDPIIVDGSSMDDTIVIGTSNDTIVHDSQVDLNTTNEHNDSEDKSEDSISQSNRKQINIKSNRNSSQIEESIVTENDTLIKSESHNDEYITSDLETVKDAESFYKDINEKCEKLIDGDIDDNEIENGPNAFSKNSDIQSENVNDDKNEKSLDENITNDRDVNAESEKIFNKDVDNKDNTKIVPT